MPQSKKPKRANKRSELRQVGLLGTIPMLLATGPLIGFFVGRWLDGKFGTEPYLMILLLILGIAASLKETIKIIKQANRENEDREI